MEEINQNWSFEVVAVPQDNTTPVTTNTTPIKIKIKVKRADNTGAHKYGFIKVPKLKHKNGYTEEIRVVRSSQTIMSFNMLAQPEYTPKPRRNTENKFFNVFKTGKCQSTQNKREVEPPYMSESSTESEKMTSQSLLRSNNIKQKQGRLEKTHTNPTSKEVASNNMFFFGKCKRGGCLDPPFGEDKYSYEPATAKNASYKENKKEKCKKSLDNKSNSEVIDKNDISITKVESNEPSKESTFILYKANTEICSSKKKLSDSLITYPPDSSLTVVNESVTSRKTTIDSKRHISDGSDTYFMPPKQNKSPEKNKAKNILNIDTQNKNHSLKHDYEINRGNQLIQDIKIIKSFITSEKPSVLTEIKYSDLQLTEVSGNEVLKVNNVEDPRISIKTATSCINTVKEIQLQLKNANHADIIQTLDDITSKEEILQQTLVSDSLEDSHTRPVKLKSAILTSGNDVLKMNKTEDPLISIKTDTNLINTVEEIQLQFKNTDIKDVIEEVDEITSKEEILQSSVSSIKEDLCKRSLKLKSAILTQPEDNELSKDNINVVNANSCKDLPPYLSTIPILQTETENDLIGHTQSHSSLRLKNQETISTRSSEPLINQENNNKQSINKFDENTHFDVLRNSSSKNNSKQEAISESNSKLLDLIVKLEKKKDTSSTEVKLKDDIKNVQDHDISNGITYNFHEKMDGVFNKPYFLDEHSSRTARLIASNDVEKSMNIEHENEKNKINFETQNGTTKFRNNEKSHEKLSNINEFHDVVLKNYNRSTNEEISSVILSPKPSEYVFTDSINERNNFKKEKVSPLINIGPSYVSNQESIPSKEEHSNVSEIKIEPIEMDDQDEKFNLKNELDGINEVNQETSENQNQQTIQSYPDYNLVSKYDSTNHVRSDTQPMEEDTTKNNVTYESTLIDNLTKKNKNDDAEFKETQEIEYIQYLRSSDEMVPLDKYLRNMIDNEIISHFEKNISRDTTAISDPILEDVNNVNDTFENTNKSNSDVQNSKENATIVTNQHDNYSREIAPKDIPHSVEPQSNHSLLDFSLDEKNKSFTSSTKMAIEVYAETPSANTIDKILSPNYVKGKRKSMAEESEYDNELNQKHFEAADNKTKIPSKVIKPVISKASKTDVLSKSMIVDFAFQTYTNENNEKVLKTFDAKKEPQRLLNDNTYFIRKTWNVNDKKVLLNLDATTQLSLELKSTNNCLNEKKKLHNIKEGATNGIKFRYDWDNTNFSKTNINKLHETLAAIYENDLVPVERLIKSSTLEINKIMKHRAFLKKKYFGTKKPKPLKPMYSNKCICSKK